MHKQYVFSDSVPNPSVQKLKKQITIRLDEETIAYFKDMAKDKVIPYQSLINLHLRGCAQAHRNLKLQWQ
jgi:predicted DNA binding CopG/RHH family protein